MTFRTTSRKTGIGCRTGAQISRLSSSAVLVMAIVFLLSFSAVADLRAQEAEDDYDLDADLQALADDLGLNLEIPTWEFSGEVELSAGYNDNVLLAALDPRGSSFVQGTANAFAWRVPDGGWEWVSFVDATLTHYLEDDLDDAILVMARSEATWDSSETVTLSAAGMYFYQDEVIDASDLESGLGATRAKLHHFGLEQKSIWDFSRGWNTSLRLKAGNYEFKPPLDDFREYNADWEMRRSLRSYGDVLVTMGYLLRDYADRPQSNASGNPIPGTLLQVDQTSLGIGHEARGGKEWRWKTRVRTSYMENRDNGSGWYDYDRVVASADLTVDHGPWVLDTELSWRSYDYLLQRVGFGNPPLRERDEWAMFVRLERELGESWVVYAEAEFERNDSTDPFLVYDVNTVMAGFRWTR
jgi:hypothetical protein